MVNINDAAGAYLNTMKQLQGGAAADVAKGSALPAGAPSFGEVLKQSAQMAIDAQHRSEKTAAAASLLGQADMTDVLQAVNDAEVALNTVLAVRDRVVQAYQEIMRTPI